MNLSTSITLSKWVWWLILVVLTGLLLWWLVPAAFSNPVSATLIFVSVALATTFAVARKE